MTREPVFDDKLKSVVDDVEGCIGCLLMGLDGSPTAVARHEGKLDAGMIGAEFSYIVSRAREAADSLSLGGLEEMAIQVERLFIVVRMVGRDYFVAGLLSSKASYGECRNALRAIAPQLAEDL